MQTERTELQQYALYILIPLDNDDCYAALGARITVHYEGVDKGQRDQGSAISLHSSPIVDY